jgi:hypothetical protein
MVKAPMHKKDRQAKKESEGDEESSSHPTKDSEHRDKAAKGPENFGTFGNQWDARAAGGE